MLHATINELYSPQKNTFRRLINSAFALAGTFWIIIYALRWLDLITEEAISSLRHGQTLPYFVLLSLWGTEFMREAKRYKCIIALANSKNIAPQLVTKPDLGVALAQFSVLKPLAGRSWIITSINVMGLAAGYGLVLNQYWAMVNFVR